MVLTADCRCFFFQAEDGIRDGHVTGVQTCALPISDRGGSAQAGAMPRPLRTPFPGTASATIRGDTVLTALTPIVWGTTYLVTRSEERRVGKEWRARGSP